GASGAYGFYEALDYTAPRLPEGAQVAVVRAYMAHHQGMVVVAIANVVHDGAMRARFHAEPIVQATELLLQERTPRDVAVARPRAGQLRGHVLRGPGGDRPARRRHRDHAPGDRVARGRCRGASCLADEFRDEEPGDRADIVRRGRPGAAGGGRGPPDVFQPE